MGHKERIWTY